MKLEDYANLFKLLSDSTRLTILKLIQHRELCVCELVDILPMSQPAISQHLRKLRDAGLVHEEKRGQWVHYSLNAHSDTASYLQQVLEDIPDQEDKLEAMAKKGAHC